MKNLIEDERLINDQTRWNDIVDSETPEVPMEELMKKADEEWEKAREEADIRKWELEERAKTTKKFIIAGSRSIVGKENYEVLCKLIEEKNLMGSISEVVCGMARGADELGYRWALEHNIPVREFPANWDKIGKAAGFVRNEEMAEYADGLILLWDGISRGALDMFNRALEHELEVHYINLGPARDLDPVCELPWAPSEEEKVICSCKHKHSKKEKEENICSACGLIIDAHRNTPKGEEVLIAGSYICPQCGRVLTEEEVNNICTECGATLDKSTVAEELIGGTLTMRRHINTEEKHERVYFVRTCEECGEEIISGACACGLYEGNVAKKEKRPELKKEEYIPSDLFVHAKDCRCESCLPQRKLEINNILRFGCKNPL